MFKYILVAVDDSKTSALALQEAIQLAQEQNAKLRIAHVVDETTLNWPESGDVDEVQETFRKTGRKILESAAQAARQAGMSAETKMVEIETFGHRVSDMIAGEAQSCSADLIVVGTHGRRGIRRMLFGSVAEELTRVAATPVLTIRSA